MIKKIPVGIIGISGYTGLELFKMLNKHPYFEICYIANSSGGEMLDQIHPSLKKISNLKVSIANPKEAAQQCQLIFLALPHQESMKFCKELLKFDTKVIDLSADYRLTQINYENNYSTHLDLENLQHAVYGLVEYQREKIKTAHLVANPGCYPTASLLGLIPFLPYINSNVFIDAKSGVSGAGKKPTFNTHYPFINENIFSYNPLTHRHQIEISEKCELLGNHKIKVNFVPHLIPITQGMLISIFATLHTPIDPLEVLQKCYSNEPCIRIRDKSVDVLSVKGTNFCDIYAQINEKDIYICTSIDNLMRGASSQAIVNANLMFGFEETLAIPLMS